MTPAAISPRVALKLAKILGLLGSDHPGERAAAGAAADAMIKQAGLSWYVVLGVEMQDLDALALVEGCLEHGELLTSWEKEFIDGLADAVARGRRLSGKQSAILARIHSKIRERAR
jgi:hypothetical protein